MTHKVIIDLWKGSPTAHIEFAGAVVTYVTDFTGEPPTSTTFHLRVPKFRVIRYDTTTMYYTELAQTSPHVSYFWLFQTLNCGVFRNDEDWSPKLCGITTCNLCSGRRYWIGLSCLWSCASPCGRLSSSRLPLQAQAPGMIALQHCWSPHRQMISKIPLRYGVYWVNSCGGMLSILFRLLIGELSLSKNGLSAGDSPNF